jgi:nitroimidazol reductase NimA-like FMN-containing flavoprotein (pyridoxamine 5'-phosphate oxidase superfamily)
VRESSQLCSEARVQLNEIRVLLIGTFIALDRNGGNVVTRVLSEEEALEVIKAGKVGRLGCIDKDEPYVVPINCLVDEGSIYSHSLPGRKIDAMRSHPRACLQVDHIDDDFHWRSAIAFGNFEEINNPRDRRAILGKLLTRFPQLTPVESMIVQDAAAPDSVVFRITVDRITGVEEG